MKAYFFKVLFAAFGLLLLVNIPVHFLLTDRAPLAADYWLRDMIVLKKHLIQEIHSPKILIVSGSSGLFGIDARQIENELQIPTFNFGMTNSLPLPFLADIAREETKPGDILVLPLEYNFYLDSATTWNSWQLRNALGWNSAEFDKMSTFGQLAIFHEVGSFDILRDLAQAKFDSYFNPKALAPRLNTPDYVIKSYQENKDKTHPLCYEYDNIDEHGDISQLPALDAPFKGKSIPLTEPENVSPNARGVLAKLIADMKQKNVKVFFANVPYVEDGEIYKGADEAEQEFDKEVREMGSDVLDRRQQLRFPYSMMYDNHLHVNTEGRVIRTQVLIDGLRKKLNLPATPPPADH